jgi:NADH-quinone oxidoreductase subunit A
VNQEYIPLLMLLGFVLFNAVLLPVLSHLLGPRRPTAIKGTPYESGMPPLGSARERFSVKFYMVAVLFILFDIEVVFLVPWAAIYFGSGTGPSMGFLLAEMAVFIAILAAGLIYVWKRGALEWD